MNIDNLQMRLSRQQRKLRKVEVQEKFAATLQSWPAIDSRHALEAWEAYWITRALKVFFVSWFVGMVIMLPVDGMVKDYFDNRQITDCEKVVAASNGYITQANCQNGVIGTTTEDGKSPSGK